MFVTCGQSSGAGAAARPKAGFRLAMKRVSNGKNAAALGDFMVTKGRLV